MYLEKLSNEKMDSLEKYLSKHAFKGEKISIINSIFDTYELYYGNNYICEIKDFETDPCYLNITKSLNNKMAMFFGEEYLKDAKKFFKNQDSELSKSLNIQIEKKFIDVKYVDKINNRLYMNQKIEENLSKLSEKNLYNKSEDKEL